MRNLFLVCILSGLSIIVNSCLTHEPASEVHSYQEKISSYLLARKELSPDTTKIDLIERKIRLNKLRKLSLSSSEYLIIADLSTLGIKFEEQYSHIVFFTIDEVIINAFIVSLTVENNFQSRDAIVLHALQLDEIKHVFSGATSIFNLELDLLQFNQL
jgi:hypothetical protein